LRKSKKGSEDDEKRSQHALSPVPFDIRAQVLEVGPDAGIAPLPGDPVLRHFPGKPPFQICEPGIHIFNYILSGKGGQIFIIDNLLLFWYLRNMARALRIPFEGAVYHITCRGNEKREIFKDDADRVRFLEILKLSLSTYQVLLYCYILMENHYHLLVETPLGNISEFMRHFNITYTSYYNKRHNRVGHLYQGRFKSILVDKESYLTILSRYIHLNPIRVRDVIDWSPREKEKYLRKYPWSSLLGYINEDKRLPFMDYSLILAEYGGDNVKGRMNYWREICGDIAGGLEIRDKVVGQSVLGSDGFVNWVRKEFAKGEGAKREIPSLRGILRYKSRDEILKAISDETDKGEREILTGKGALRQMAMELLYKYGGLKGVEIGEIMGLDYSTVSRERKRLRERLKKDKELQALLGRIEEELSKVTI
jgi:putative transposase